MQILKQMIPEHLRQKDGTSPSECLPELTEQEILAVITIEKRRRALRIGCSPESVKISDELRAKIIKQARERKQSNQLAEAYWAKVDQGRKTIAYSPSELFQKFKDTASKMIGKEFEIDAFNELIIKKLCLYFTNDPSSADHGLDLKKGILLLGGVGSGKSTIMRAFSQNQNASYRLIRSRDISYDFADNGFKIVKGYSEIQTIPVNIFGQSEQGICIDDLGTDEERKHFGDKANALTEIILNRYDLNRHNLTHMTTNLNAKMVEEVYGTRVRSRMREMFNQITFDIKTPDRRK